MRSRSPWGRCKQAGVCTARGPERCGFDGDVGPSGIDRAQLSRSSPGELPQAKPAQARAVQGSRGAACALGEPLSTTLRIRVQPCNPTPDREPRDHPRLDTSRLSPSHASHTHPEHIPNGGGQALRCGEQIRKACRFGEGWPGDLRAIQLLLNWRRQSPASPVRTAETGVQRVRLSFPWEIINHDLSGEAG